MNKPRDLSEIKMLTPSEFEFLQHLSDLTYCNPFLPERVELESKLLGIENRRKASVWNHKLTSTDLWKNSEKIAEMIRPKAEKLRTQLFEGLQCSQQEFELYEDMLVYMFYDELRSGFNAKIDVAEESDVCDFEQEWQHFLSRVDYFCGFASNGKRFRTLSNPAHVFACYFQIIRLFANTFYCIVGSSLPAAKLRAAIWQSVMTHNMRRYEKSLFKRMGDIPTLITGPSGTGKELVARSIAKSRYIPFDPSTGRFQVDYREALFAVNLAALSPTLIESELFGHSQGAFTGANHDRQGLFESCGQYGTVFLDEIGELEGGLQVNLLRVLQSRTFQRLGDLANLQFAGKLIAATNRDLVAEMQEGRFREDLYYRLCADMIETPSLREQLLDKPEGLYDLILHLAQPMTDDYDELAGEVIEWIDQNLGPDYGWPGNVRELEQCLRNVMIRGVYRPAYKTRASLRTVLSDEFLFGKLSAEELLSRYCTMIYAETGSYEESARRLKIDRRTVKSKVDQKLLEQIQSGELDKFNAN